MEIYKLYGTVLWGSNLRLHFLNIGSSLLKKQILDRTRPNNCILMHKLLALNETTFVLIFIIFRQFLSNCGSHGVPCVSAGKTSSYTAADTYTERSVLLLH